MHFLLQILCSADPKLLRLTPVDDLIYKAFREEFPILDVRIIDENDLKSKKEKDKWRPFCERFKTLLDDYSFGTLLRSDAEKDYSEENTMLVTRIQFLCIEIARNKEGINDILRKKFKLTNQINKDSSNNSQLQFINYVH